MGCCTHAVPRAHLLHTCRSGGVGCCALSKPKSCACTQHPTKHKSTGAQGGASAAPCRRLMPGLLELAGSIADATFDCSAWPLEKTGLLTKLEIASSSADGVFDC